VLLTTTGQRDRRYDRDQTGGMSKRPAISGADGELSVQATIVSRRAIRSR
jgi:hypothetical protein